LRRTAIKDVAAYLGFLAGFIGAAPFAWGLLSDQLADGSFVRGLWYFFGIVVAAGIFAGIAGLGFGFVAGVIWEQVHRHRRREILKAKAIAEAKEDVSQADLSRPATDQPRLQLVMEDHPVLPPIDGRTLSSVLFDLKSIKLDFAGVRIEVSGNPQLLCGGQRFRYPDSGSRDALCSLIGDRVLAVRIAADRFEIRFISGADLMIQRNSIAVA
ncbi:MAG TPA: hypothetical protein VGC52_10710, partial [Gemmatimonadaceae bacterium]